MLKVPAPRETADKILKYLMHRDPDDETSRDRRQTKQNKTNNVVFVIDSSNSIRERDFRVGLEALKLLVKKASPSTRYALINFATEAEVISAFITPEEILEELGNVSRLAGLTNTQAALALCRNRLFANKT